MLPLLSSLSPDVFHSTANVLPFGIQSSSVLTINDFQYKFFPENFSWIKRHYLDVGMRLSIRYATKVICISETTKRHAIEICGADKKKLHVVDAAGLALGEYEKHTGEDVLRNRYTLESPFILYAASGFPHKNLLRLVEAFGLIANDIQQDLVITGEPFGISKELDRAVQKHLQNAKKRVHITGFIPREDLLGLYSIADCYILPSLFEGFGISLLEAMACGCPVIASNSTALPGTAGNAALYCNPESIESIAISLKRLLSNEKLRSSLISLGLQRANSFSWERVARETVAVYRSIIEN
jgi:glycosyltransferase involved in cell wall biosynthesis